MDDRAEVIGAIVLLLTDATSADDWVFGDEIPDTHPDLGDVAGNMPRAAIEISPTGGSGFASQSHLDMQRIDVRSYDATPEQARALALEVHEVLNRLVRVQSDGILIHSAIPSGGFLSDRQFDTRWPFTWRSYNVLYDMRTEGGSG